MVNVNGLLRSVAPLVVNTSCSVMCTVLRLPSAEVISNPRWCDTTVIEKPQTSETSKGAIVSSKDSLTGLSAYAGAAAESGVVSGSTYDGFSHAALFSRLTAEWAALARLAAGLGRRATAIRRRTAQ